MKNATNTENFHAGFEYVLRDWAAGITWEQSFDLASTPADRRPQSFLDGAKSAGNALAGWLDEARRYAKAYGLTAAEADELVARTRLPE